MLRGWHCYLGAAESPGQEALLVPGLPLPPPCRSASPKSQPVGQHCSVRKCRCKWRCKQLEGMADASGEGEEVAGDRPQALTFPFASLPFSCLRLSEQSFCWESTGMLRNQPFSRQEVEAQFGISTHPKIMGCQSFDGLPGGGVCSSVTVCSCSSRKAAGKDQG